MIFIPPGFKNFLTSGTQISAIIHRRMYRSHWKSGHVFPIQASHQSVQISRGKKLTFTNTKKNNHFLIKNYSKEKEKANFKEEIEEQWGGSEAFKLITFLKDDLDAQIEKHPHILVFFSATWCHHCRQLRKPFGVAALMAKEANLPIVFATFDINHNPDLAQAKGVVGIPLIKYYERGKFVTNYKGKRTAEQLFEFAKNPPKALATPQNKIDF